MKDAEVQSAVHVIIFSTIDFVFDQTSTFLWNLVSKLLNLGEKADFSDYKCIRTVSMFGFVCK